MLDGDVDLFSSETSPLATLARIIGVLGAGLVAVLLLLVVAECVERLPGPKSGDGGRPVPEHRRRDEI